MEQQDVYRELSKKLMMENSTVLSEIWKLVCTEEEARVVNALPATAADLASAFKKGMEEMQAMLDELYHRGAVFDYFKDGSTFYRMPRHVVQFHDSTILWKEGPEKLMELWERFGETDYRDLLELVTTLNLPSFMRVIPVNETIAARSQVLAPEDALEILKSASAIAVTTCVCRKLMKRCGGPLEVCLQINKGAEYTLKRGTGRKVNFDEAVAILKQSEEAGLVHMTENMGRSNVICNCCPCCCEMLRFATDTKTRGVLAPSRFRAGVDAEECTGCGSCEDICPVEAIAVNDDGIAAVTAETCIGCGLCATACPVDAIQLIEARPAST